MRLEDEEKQTVFLTPIVFQFQGGAVRSLQKIVSVSSMSCFNSKVVRLEVRRRHTLQQQWQRFNSKVVRLEDPKTVLSGLEKIRFNSKVVRLEAVALVL